MANLTEQQAAHLQDAATLACEIANSALTSAKNARYTDSNRREADERAVATLAAVVLEAILRAEEGNSSSS